MKRTPRKGDIKISDTGWLCVWNDTEGRAINWWPIIKLTDQQLWEFRTLYAVMGDAINYDR